MTDRELAARWDPDHRLAALSSLVAGLVVVVGTALIFSVALSPVEAIINGDTLVDPFGVNVAAALLLVVDLGLLVFVVGLLHALSDTRSYAVTLGTAVVTLTTAVSATIHLAWGYAASAAEVELAAPEVHFITWLSANLWLMPLYGLLVGATLLGVALALDHSSLRFARRLAVASAVVGGLLVVLAPFAAMGEYTVFVLVASTFLATGGISVLLAVTLIRLATLLRRPRRVQAHAV